MALSILILTGQSGSGKSTVLRALEDEGYFCVDNIPTGLVEQLLQGIDEAQLTERLALGIDVREGRFLAQAPALVARLRAGPRPVRLVFLAADDAAMVRRYSQTRRLHPLDTGAGLRAAIAQERQLLTPLRELADDIWDTSASSPHALRARVVARLGGAQAADELRAQVLSFGFKHGLPLEADMVLDVRFLRNPYFVPALRPQSGLDAPVRDYVLAAPECGQFIQHAQAMLAFLLPEYRKEGKRYFTLAIGCTGGRHRSVALASQLTEFLRSLGVMAALRHRDLEEIRT